MGRSSSKCRPSICSGGLNVTFYWHQPQEPDDLHQNLDAAVRALWEAIRLKGQRFWNPFVAADTKGVFRARLKAAAKGRLEPVRQVAGLGDGQPPLWEIRWQDVAVVDVVESVHVPSEVMMRLIIGEAPFAVWAIALHAHEKAVLPAGDSATRAAQDAEIEVACERWVAGLPSLWGRK